LSAELRSFPGGAVEAEKIDAMLVTDLNNVRYLSGFTGSNAAAAGVRR